MLQKKLKKSILNWSNKKLSSIICLPGKINSK